MEKLKQLLGRISELSETELWELRSPILDLHEAKQIEAEANKVRRSRLWCCTDPAWRSRLAAEFDRDRDGIGSDTSRLHDRGARHSPTVGPERLQ